MFTPEYDAAFSASTRATRASSAFSKPAQPARHRRCSNRAASASIPATSSPTGVAVSRPSSSTTRRRLRLDARVVATRGGASSSGHSTPVDPPTRAGIASRALRKFARWCRGRAGETGREHRNAVTLHPALPRRVLDGRQASPPLAVGTPPVFSSSAMACHVAPAWRCWRMRSAMSRGVEARPRARPCRRNSSNFSTCRSEMRRCSKRAASAAWRAGRFHIFAPLLPSSAYTSPTSRPCWVAASASERRCAASPMPLSACAEVLTRTYPASGGDLGAMTSHTQSQLVYLEQILCERPRGSLSDRRGWQRSRAAADRLWCQHPSRRTA